MKQKIEHTFTEIFQALNALIDLLEYLKQHCEELYKQLENNNNDKERIN